MPEVPWYHIYVDTFSLFSTSVQAHQYAVLATDVLHVIMYSRACSVNLHSSLHEHQGTPYYSLDDQRLFKVIRC